MRRTDAKRFDKSNEDLQIIHNLTPSRIDANNPIYPKSIHEALPGAVILHDQGAVRFHPAETIVWGG